MSEGREPPLKVGSSMGEDGASRLTYRIKPFDLDFDEDLVLGVLLLPLTSNQLLLMSHTRTTSS